MEIEAALGADIIMAFDECVPYPADHDYTEKSMHMTHRWAKRCRVPASRRPGAFRHRSGRDLRGSSGGQRKGDRGYGFHRQRHRRAFRGEPKPMMYEMLEVVNAILPKNKPRYLMGVGSPDCFFEGVLRGVDMFDCVLQTRIARNGQALTSRGPLTIRNATFERDFSAIDPDCGCYACKISPGRTCAT